MKKIIKFTLPILVAITVLFGSCKKNPSPDMEIFSRLSGIWMTNTPGAPMIYIIANEEFQNYYYTYPYPIEAQDEEAGVISVEANRITFTSLSTNDVSVYAYVLSDKDKKLTLTTDTGFKSEYTRQERASE